MDEAVFKRIPPHNDEAERAVIGSMMMDQDAVQIASEQLQGEDFYNGQYGVIFSALVEMHQQGVGTDLVTIQNKLREMEIPPELTSVEYIGDLINSVPTSANIRYYVKIVQEKSVLRSLIKVTESITGNCYLDKNPLEDILEDAEPKLRPPLPVLMETVMDFSLSSSANAFASSNFSCATFSSCFF